MPAIFHKPTENVFNVIFKVTSFSYISSCWGTNQIVAQIFPRSLSETAESTIKGAVCFSRALSSISSCVLEGKDGALVLRHEKTEPRPLIRLGHSTTWDRFSTWPWRKPWQFNTCCCGGLQSCGDCTFQLGGKKKTGSWKEGDAWGFYEAVTEPPNSKRLLLTEDASEVGKFLGNSEILKWAVHFTGSQRSEVRPEHHRSAVSFFRVCLQPCSRIWMGNGFMICGSIRGGDI